MHVSELIEPLLSAIDLSAYGTSEVRAGRASQGSDFDTTIIFQSIDERALMVKDGPAPMDNIIMQIDVYRKIKTSTQNRKVCYQISEIVRNALTHYSSSNMSIYYESSTGAMYEEEIERWRVRQQYKIMQHR